VAEILLEADTVAAPSEDEGRIRASHILYSPGDDPSGAAALDPADPAWAAAEAEATKAAEQLRKVTDPDLRAKAFATRARSQSDDTGSGANGGDLGYFTHSAMVPEFADPLFADKTLVAGDIVGPVKSDFGWHVIEFVDRIPGVQERIDEVKARLGEAGADFAAVAKDLSDGAEAANGGDLGWRAEPQMDEAAWTAVTALEPGTWTAEAIPEDDGYHFYELIEQAARPLDVQQRAIIGANAFSDWYDPQKTDAATDGTITRDEDLFSNTPQVGG
jgi:parvulin-like peptidyl-prolyl isomerase